MALLDYRRIAVPRDLGAVTTIDRAAETPPNDLGVSARGVTRIWSAVENLYRTGLQPAITLVVRRHGQILMKRSIGHVRGVVPGEDGPPELITPDAPICLFSASKAVTALLVHQLAQEGKLKLDDRVADYLPKFGTHGKERVTIRQLLAHRAGIPRLPVTHPDPSLLQHWDAMVDMLCLAPPFDPRFEKQAYHALTSGFIIGELVRKVGKVELRDALRQWLADPLKLRYMTYGLAAEHRDLAPLHYRTGPRAIWPAAALAKRILGVDFERAVVASNDDAFRSSVVPAGNIYASADDAGRLFQMLLNGGELDGVRVMQPDTVRAATTPVGKLQLDGMLGIPIRFSPGFMLGENPFGLWGPNCRGAFGHIGFLTVLCWADPRRDISVALLNNGKSVAPAALLQVVRVVGAISRSCRPVR